ncbi:Six-hairpin glycosidase-like protein [Chaetomidium leptoderma]|uniref:Six-hairpin glycosidase-like protein n=1 Tax=Chaetomidium leptoderma TaxID=669021 RepID=A0AAN6ZSJ4_9PEZI|nr:Six-hairpin glycosidase-like protein [Chaetomidium leptoderma]
MALQFITAFLVLGFAPVVDAAAAWDSSRFAVYTSDAGNDFRSAIPIGNGRLGATVFGTAVEKLVLNENSVWSGPWQDRANRNSKNAVPEIQRMLLAGDITGAGQSAMANMAGNPTSPKAYHPLVNMNIDLSHSSGVSSYTRWLDTREGTAGVTYLHGGTNYSREYIASYPHGVLGLRLGANGSGKLNVKLSLSRSQWVLSQAARVDKGTGGHAISLAANSGQSSNALAFWSEARVVNSGGACSVASPDGKSISITGADTIDIFFNAETSYRYSSTALAQAELKRKLDAAVAAGYPAVRSAAIADFSALMGRVKLDLGSSGNAGLQPVPTRLSNFKKNPGADPQLMTLMFNFGRHLLAASSRDTGRLSLPANLQGLWNQDYDPAWQSKYTININLEMNYWPALVTNLAETQKPVFDLINVAIPRGQAVAKTMYGCDSGFVLHHNTDLWGDAAPVDKGTPYTVWPMGAAWLSSDVMEHYRFTQNKTFLEQVAWPILRQTAQFYYCYLFKWKNYWTVGPSLSPEHAFIVPSSMRQGGKSEGLDISIEMDNQLLHQLFTNLNETCTILGLASTDGDCTAAAKDYLPHIRPPSIGPNGRLLEWRDASYGETEPGHRHFSNLWGLYPGQQLTPSTSSQLAAAAGALLDHRMASGSGSTGWSRAWAINLYARLLRGDTAWEHAQALVQKFPSANLWNSDSGAGSPFQIDGNFGLVAGMAEMLLQSHGGVVHLLPALPAAAVPKGSVSGLVARGDFVVEDLVWSGGQFAKATITSRSGGLLAVRVQGGKAFSVNGASYSGGITTTVGGVYQLVAA